MQYASATGTGLWQVTPLTSHLLEPGQRYLVREAGNANGTSALPAADASGSIALSATAGKVALVDNLTPLSGACPSSSAVVDLLGFGTSANCSETARAPAAGTNTALFRREGGCADTGNNSADFSAGQPDPRNSSSPLSPCPQDGAQTEAGAPSPVHEWEPPLLFLLYAPFEFSAPRPTAGSTRWRRGASASSPRGTRGGRPRPPGAWP